MDRVISRFIERAKNRSPLIEADLADLYAKDDKEFSLAQLALDPYNTKEVAREATVAHREYMAREAV